jgi:hypothetical protein
MIIAPFVSVLILAILVTNCFFGIATYGETKSAAVSEGNLQSYVGGWKGMVYRYDQSKER